MKALTRATTVAFTLICLVAPLHAQESGSIMADVVYGHKAGMALTLDVFMPSGEPNGAAVLNMVSGGWVSRWRDPEQDLDPWIYSGSSTTASHPLQLRGD